MKDECWKICPGVSAVNFDPTGFAAIVEELKQTGPDAASAW